MGIWGFIGSTAEAVKRNAPDATPVKNACKSSYNYSAAAYTKIGEAVAPPVIGHWMPDDETKSKILMYTAKFVKNAGLYVLHESYKSIPGGVAVSKIFEDTVKDVQSEILKSEKLKALDENVGSSKKQ